MRILQVVAGLGVGGAEYLVMHLSRWLLRNGHEVEVLNIHYDTALQPRMEQAGIPVHNLRTMPFVSRRFPVELGLVLRRFKPDIVHCHNAAWRKTAMACRLVHIPCIWTMHGYHELWLKSQKSWIRHALEYTQYLVGVDTSVCDLIRRELAFAQEKVVYIPNGIPDIFTSTPPPVQWGFSFPEEAVLIGMVSRLQEPKDPFTLVDAVVQVKKSCPQIRLLFVGSGDMEDSLRSYVQQRGAVEYVYLLGQRDDVSAILHHLRLFALISLSEGQSLALLEAMSAQRPIVATNVGGNPILLANGECGILVPPRNPQALAEAILELLIDREKALRLACNARQRFLSEFTTDTMGKRYIELYEKALSERGDKKCL